MLPTPDHPERTRSSAGEIRVSDADRDRYIAVLRTQCAEGRLTLEEFSQRVELVYAADLRSQLEAVVVDLPVPWHSPARAQARVATVRHKIRSRRWHVAVFGETARRGRYRLSGETAAVAVFGECTLDLTNAELSDPEPVIDAIAVFGHVTIIVPAGIDIALDGVAIFGEKRLSGDDDSVAGAPVLVVRAFATFGEVRVRRSSPRPDTPRSGGGSG